MCIHIKVLLFHCINFWDPYSNSSLLKRKIIVFLSRDSAFSRNAFTRNCKLYVKQKSKLQTIKHFESNSIVLDAFYGFNVWKNKTNCLHIILSGFVCIFCALFLRFFYSIIVSVCAIKCYFLSIWSEGSESNWIFKKRNKKKLQVV